MALGLRGIAAEGGKGEGVGQLERVVQGEELENVGVLTVRAYRHGAGPTAVAEGACAGFESANRAGLGETTLRDAVQRRVYASSERMGRGLPDRHVRVLHDEHEFRCADRRRCPGEVG
ncbi:hypothetical protein ASC63_07955 [Leifsonia sp. Root112D2]|jgi:hypothetical protein|nr:hypothetical protein ASC63_07955 [Leifsonia sp. Root112D2]